MLYQRRLIILGFLFLLAVAVDGLKFVFVGGPNIINWHSFIHPAWVLVTIALIFLAAWLNTTRVWQILFWLYFLVFASALLNQYFNFWSVLTYNCMLFNLVFTMLYFFLSAPQSKED